MEQQLLLNLGQGDWQSGFASISAQFWSSQHQPSVQCVGSLPPAIHLAEYYHQWQQLYQALYGAPIRTTGGYSNAASGFEFEVGQLTNVSQHRFDSLRATLKTALNQWLAAAAFVPIERQIRTQLAPDSPVRLILMASNREVLRFPWQLWQLLEDYPRAELSVSLPNYSQAFKQVVDKTSAGVKVLAVLGNDEGIDIKTDRQILDQLPQAEVTLLVQPTLADLQQHLWSSRWDVLFFAGHSSGQAQGYLQVNDTELLTVEQLKYALRKAIANGLQLAILNSCDGLNLAWALADLQLPQTIVMREPVSDAIAQQFLKAFLTQLADGQSLYLSVRAAREQLHGLTDLGACATWFPVIVQNPSEVSPTWRSLASGRSPAEAQAESQPKLIQKNLTDKSSLTLEADLKTDQSQSKRAVSLKTVGFRALLVAGAVLGLRWMGWLQGVELQAYDRLMQVRPLEVPDSRIVIVTVDEKDIQMQTSLERRGSLSDETLQQILSTLLSYEPRVIALDLYRDFPATTPELKNLLSHPDVLGLCKSRDPVADTTGIGPAPELGAQQVGFSDFIEETDGILRRQLVTLTPDPVSSCRASYGFAALVAIHYLQQDALLPSFTAEGNLKIGERVFPRLPQRAGGLQQLDNRGNQIFLNYRALRSPDQIAVTVPIQQLLAGKVAAESLRDRVVVIGVTAPSGDYWATPYGVQGENKTPGVFIQAQMMSQIMSTVLDSRPLIWVLPQWVEIGCIVAGAIAGSVLSYRKTSQRLLFGFITAGSLSLGAWVMIVAGGWMPAVPTLLAFCGGVLFVTTDLPSTGLFSSTEGSQRKDTQR